MNAIINEIVQLKTRMDELERRQQNLIMHGRIVEVDANKIKVDTGEIQTPWIYFLVHSAGNVRTWRQPVIGERCIVLSLTAGLDMQSIAIVGAPSDQFTPPSLEPNTVITDYGNGMTETFDLTAGMLTCAYPGGLKITADINVTGNQTLSGTSTAADHLSDGVSGKNHVHAKGSLEGVHGPLKGGDTAKPS